MRSFLLPRRSFLRGSQTGTWATRGCSSPTSHWAEVPSSNATCSLPRNSSSSSSIAAALVGMTRSNSNFPRPSQTATEMVSRCTSRPTYLLPLSMRVLLVVESCGLIHRQLTPQGRPFIMRRKRQNLTTEALRRGEQPRSESRTQLPSHHPDQHRDADDDPVNGERRESPLADPVHEPCHYGQGHDERHDEADEEHGPLMAVGGHAAQGFCAVFGMEGFEQVITGGGDHGGHRKKERKLQSGGAGHAGHLSGSDGGHGARGARKNRRRHLADADPDGLDERNVFHAFRHVATHGARRTEISVDDPHDHAAHEQRHAHYGKAFKVLANQLGQQQ